MASLRQGQLNAALRLLARTVRGRFLRCAATGKIMFDTPQLAGHAARLLHDQQPARRWDAVKCGRHNHYHLRREDYRP